MRRRNPHRAHPMADTNTAVIKVVATIGEIDAAAWDACANPHPGLFNPFVSHAFLQAIEEAGNLGGPPRRLPQHLGLEAPTGGIAAAAPAYVKTHSRGEYVFDDAWADA